MLTPARCVRLILAVLLVGLASWRLFDYVWQGEQMEPEDWFGVGICTVVVWALVGE